MTKIQAVNTIYSPDDASWDDYRFAEQSHDRAISVLLGEL